MEQMAITMHSGFPGAVQTNYYSKSCVILQVESYQTFTNLIYLHWRPASFEWAGQNLNEFMQQAKSGTEEY